MSTQLAVPIDERTYTVDAISGARPFYSIDSDGSPVQIGAIGYIDYDKDRSVRRLAFQPSDPKAKMIELGHTGKAFSILDHYQVVQPLIDSGFRPEILSHARGGAKLFATFSHPDIVIDDPIQWDHRMFKNIPSPELRFSIGVWADMRIGKTIQMTAGFFRLVCTNGLISRVLGMGDVHIPHKNFAVDKVQRFLSGLVNPRTNAPKFPTFDARAFEWPRQLLASDTDITMLPPFVQEPVSTLTHALPKWAQTSLSNQMAMAMQGTDHLTSLDVLNMVTNVSNERETDRLYFKMESVVSALMKVAAIGAFKNDIPFSYN